jgi:uncharacterized protein YcbK (DUF882 family)
MQSASACDFAARRRALRLFAWTAFSFALPFSPAAWAAAPRSVSLYHAHTGERFEGVYFDNGEYLPDALAGLNRLLRDFRTGDACDYDARLFDTLYALNLACGEGAFQVISAFRSEQTNRMLRQQSRRVAKDSLHMSGRAIDVRLAGRDSRHLRDAALALQSGGVGYYARSNFVHLDTGPVRRW